MTTGEIDIVGDIEERPWLFYIVNDCFDSTALLGGRRACIYNGQFEKKKKKK